MLPQRVVFEIDSEKERNSRAKFIVRQIVPEKSKVNYPTACLYKRKEAEETVEAYRMAAEARGAFVSIVRTERYIETAGQIS